MKHLKRSDRLRQTRKAIKDYYFDKDESANMIQKQINQAWESKEQEEAERIKREIDCAWEEYYALINNDDSNAENEKDFQCEDIIMDEFEKSEPVYRKDKKRTIRRRATKRANKRVIMKAKNAVKNSRKRYKDDLKNLTCHKSEDLKSRVARCDSLERKANKLQC